MARRSLLTIAVVLLAAAGVWAAVSDRPRSATVSLERTVHFLGPDGSEEVVPAGTYHVEVAGASSLRLVPSGGKKGMLVQALATSHTEKLATPVALSILVNDGEHHLVVLLPDGTGFDAVGSPTGIRPRGSAAVPLTQAQVHNLLAQQVQQKTTSPGSVAGPLGVPTKPTLRRIPADVAIPPDVQALQRFSTLPAQQKMIGTAREGSMEKLRRLSPTNALPPATSKPPELQRLEKMATRLNLAPKPRPTVNGLLETLRNLPGGREAIEEAKRHGARISMKSTQSDYSPFARLNPLGISEAAAQQDFTMTLTPEKPGDSWLQFIGVWLWVPNRPMLDSSILTRGATGGAVSSRAMFRVTVPRDGLYLVNIEASSAGVKASLHTGGVVHTWDHQGLGGGNFSYPVILDLAAGKHWFHWILEAGTAEFRAATVDSL